MAEGVARNEWPHHQILRSHRQYAFRQYLQIQDAVPYLEKRKAVTKGVRKEIQRFPENKDDNMNFLLAYLRDAKVERFVRFIEALGDSTQEIKNHVILIETMSESLEKISNADMDQVRRVREVVRFVREGPSETQIEGEASTETKKGVLSPVEEGVSAETTVEGELSFEAKMKVMSKVKELESAETKVEGGVSAETVEGAHAEDKTTSKLSLASLPPQRSIQYPGFVEPRFASLFDRESLADGHSEWLVHDPAHGVRINIPADSVPANVEKFAVKIHTYINGNFHIPHEYEICTAIFMIQTDPQFEFLKPVSLKLPHCAIFDGDEDEDDLVILCAPDPDMHDDKNTPTPRTAPPICTFSDILCNVDLSEDYYIQIDLDHFSAFVGAKKRRKYRRPTSKSRLTLNLSRESSINKQKRSRRSAMRKRIKKADSMGSSRQSSYESSFDKEEKLVVLKRQQSPLLRQYSSAESDGPLYKQLQRQAAITDDATLQHQSSSIDDLSSIQILVCCCHPVQRITNWKTCFMVAPHLPTGKKALKDAELALKKKRCVDMESTKHAAFPTSNFICFEPEKWDGYWRVSANTTPQIHLDQIHEPYLDQDEPYHYQGRPPYIDFHVESTNQSSSPLSHKIKVTGAETNNKEIFFTIESTEKQANYTTGTIHTESWLYEDDSEILQALKNEENIALKPIPDHYKLIADIALQLPHNVCYDLLEKLSLSNTEKSSLEVDGKADAKEFMYKGFVMWMSSRRQPNLFELKSILEKMKFKGIELCHSDIPVLSENPCLCNKTCDPYLCTRLAPKVGKQWKFLGRYLGLTQVDIEDLCSIEYREGKDEAVFQMLSKWQQTYGRTASVAKLVMAVYRINQLNPSHMNEIMWFIEQVIASEFSQEDMNVCE